MIIILIRENGSVTPSEVNLSLTIFDRARLELYE